MNILINETMTGSPATHLPTDFHVGSRYVRDQNFQNGSCYLQHVCPHVRTRKSELILMKDYIREFY
jgi:hypothetical protein